MKFHWGTTSLWCSKIPRSLKYTWVGVSNSKFCLGISDLRNCKSFEQHFKKLLIFISPFGVQVIVRRRRKLLPHLLSVFVLRI